MSTRTCQKEGVAVSTIRATLELYRVRRCVNRLTCMSLGCKALQSSRRSLQSVMFKPFPSSSSYSRVPPRPMQLSGRSPGATLADDMALEEERMRYVAALAEAEEAEAAAAAAAAEAASSAAYRAASGPPSDDNHLTIDLTSVLDAGRLAVARMATAFRGPAPHPGSPAPTPQGSAPPLPLTQGVAKRRPRAGFRGPLFGIVRAHMLPNLQPLMFICCCSLAPSPCLRNMPGSRLSRQRPGYRRLLIQRGFTARPPAHSLVTRANVTHLSPRLPLRCRLWHFSPDSTSVPLPSAVPVHALPDGAHHRQECPQRVHPRRAGGPPPDYPGDGFWNGRCRCEIRPLGNPLRFDKKACDVRIRIDFQQGVRR